MVVFAAAAVLIAKRSCTQPHRAAHTGHGRALGTAPASSDPSIDALSQQIIARALERAALRRQRLSGLHLLLALCEERSSVVSECLETLGLEQPWLESQLQAV